MVKFCKLIQIPFVLVATKFIAFLGRREANKNGSTTIGNFEELTEKEYRLCEIWTNLMSYYY